MSRLAERSILLVETDKQARAETGGCSPRFSACATPLLWILKLQAQQTADNATKLSTHYISGIEYAAPRIVSCTTRRALNRYRGTANNQSRACADRLVETCISVHSPDPIYRSLRPKAGLRDAVTVKFPGGLVPQAPGISGGSPRPNPEFQQ